MKANRQLRKRNVSSAKVGISLVVTNLIVITDNLDHFERIDGLKVENWKER